MPSDKKPTILVTGFEPFAGAAYNTSEALVGRLPQSVGAYRLRAAILPVDGTIAPTMLRQLIADVKPVASVHFGLAANRERITIERRARNILDFRSPDNSGARMVERRIVRDEPDEHLTRVDVDALVESVVALGHDVEVSEDAGEFVCNQIYFHSLCVADNSLFIHLPADRRYVASGAPDVARAPKEQPSLEALVESVVAILEVLLAGIEKEGGSGT